MCKTTKMAAVAIESALYFIPSPGTYASYLAEAALRLRIAPFGDWRAPPESTNWNADDRFDKSYWTWVDDVKYTRVLKLISGKKPADAIDAILSNPDKWKIDCDHTVQIANLYAIRKVLGSEAFNLLVGDGMLLRTRESTGLNTKRHVGRDGPTKPWRVVTDARLNPTPIPSTLHFKRKALSHSDRPYLIKERSSFLRKRQLVVESDGRTWMQTFLTHLDTKTP